MEDEFRNSPFAPFALYKVVTKELGVKGIIVYDTGHIDKVMYTERDE